MIVRGMITPRFFIRELCMGFYIFTHSSKESVVPSPLS